MSSLSVNPPFRFFSQALRERGPRSSNEMETQMRTTKRFTPSVIERFIREGRCDGIYEDYIAWHKVSRGDPASAGRSHLLNWRNRLRDLLSDGELGQQLFASMLPDLDDSLEQYKLSADPSVHPLAAYGEGDLTTTFPGTLELAKELGIKHHKLNEKGQATPWYLSTDLVLVFKAATGKRHMLALAYKTNDWKKDARTCKSLKLEREYWLRRGVPWLLISPELSDFRVVLTLRRIACWALADEAPIELRRLATQIAVDHPFDSLTKVLQEIQASAGSMELAQNALWQAVWNGELPIDLTRGWRPHVPLKIVTPIQFAAFNPIASRRSAWI